nr:hypothetical protein Xcnt_20745 [Xanthomonas campestris pv. centellae]
MPFAPFLWRCALRLLASRLQEQPGLLLRLTRRTGSPAPAAHPSRPASLGCGDLAEQMVQMTHRPGLTAAPAHVLAAAIPVEIRRHRNQGRMQSGEPSTGVDLLVQAGDDFTLQEQRRAARVVLPPWTPA